MVHQYISYYFPSIFLEEKKVGKGGLILILIFSKKKKGRQHKRNKRTIHTRFHIVAQKNTYFPPVSTSSSSAATFPTTNPTLRSTHERSNAGVSYKRAKKKKEKPPPTPLALRPPSRKPPQTRSGEEENMHQVTRKAI